MTQGENHRAAFPGGLRARGAIFGAVLKCGHRGLCIAPSGGIREKGRERNEFGKTEEPGTVIFFAGTEQRDRTGYCRQTVSLASGHGKMDKNPGLTKIPKQSIETVLPRNTYLAKGAMRSVKPPQSGETVF
jgi:hypothetical protein